MRLFEAILDANQRALAGDSRAGLHPGDFPNALPVVALTCIDPRLNRLLPEVLGVHEDDFIWLRNAGNIITGSLSSTMRTLALACAIKGGKEIAVIGHSDCRVRQVSVNQLLDTFRALGVNRSSLPDNLVEFFGLFASERQNVMTGVDHIRKSPLIGPKVPVHGLMVDIESGRLEWVINGYEHGDRAHLAPPPLLQKLEHAKDVVTEIMNFNLGDMKFPEVKIGDLVMDPAKWHSEVQYLKQTFQHDRGVDPAKWRSELQVLEQAVKHVLPGGTSPTTQAPSPKPPPAIPIPPPIQVKRNLAKAKGKQP